jgi:carbamoyltransferase
MYILGISASYHDSAAVLIRDGKVVCGAEEERFSRLKHDNSFPFKAIDFCLKSSKLSIKDIDYISYYEKPLLKFERLMETFVETYPFSLGVFLKGMPEYLDYKIKIEKTIKSKLKYKRKVFFIHHHLSHASVSYYSSSLDKAAILTVDGVGEYQTTALWIGNKNEIKLLKSIDFPDSLGLLYSTFTAFLGFKINEDEYKVMGLAAYGKPKYAKQIYRLINIKEDGSFKLDQSYFGFRETFKMWNNKFEKTFGNPRKPQDFMNQKHKDLAASIQKVTEEIYFKMLNHLYLITKSRSLCLSGGVALNALANGKIYENTPFENIYIFGASGDSGAALGSALFTYHYILGKKKENQVKDLYFGSSYKKPEY